jgi:RNA polymerase sigma factor (sigma-70 family)
MLMVALTENNTTLLDQTPDAPAPVPVRGMHEADRALLGQLLVQPYDYMPQDQFKIRRDVAERRIFDEPADIGLPDTSWYHPAMNLTEPKLGKMISKTLNAAQEQVIFTQFNYARYRAAKLVEKLSRQHRNKHRIRVSEARELLEWHRKVEHLRDRIAGSNLALVLAMAKRYRMSDTDFADMISEGNMALLRSIDKFDVTRGFKFSTYACRAIIKAFARQGEKQTRYRAVFPTDFDPQFEKSNWQEEKNAEHEDDCVDELRRIIRLNKAELSEIERDVIERRFAVGELAATDKDGEPKPLTLDQVGRIIGVTKERVRQIQNKALEKIRRSLEEDFLRR